MKHIFKFTSLLLVGSILFTSCKKDDTIVNDEISQETLAQIASHGFGTNNVQKVDEGYIVEGDIVLTPEFLSRNPGGTLLRIGNEEQYRTTNLVNAGGGRVITIALDSKLSAKAGYPAALTEVARRYNAERLSLTFQVVSSGANITFVNGNGQFLASAGFPTSTGNPYGTVKVNAQSIGKGTSTTFVNFLATILAHEAGHCIGFRHTDYFNRAISCGGSVSNEGASTVGAIPIDGTPTGADLSSWMLACISRDQNRPFSNYDKIALGNLYP